MNRTFSSFFSKIINRKDYSRYLINSVDNFKLFNDLVLLQNEINAKYDNKVIGITSLENDYLTACFAKAFSDVYLKNKSTCLIIDCNLYGPCFGQVLLDSGKPDNIVELNDNPLHGEPHFEGLVNKWIPLNKTIYPTVFFRKKDIHAIVDNYVSKFEHVIVILPSVRKHEDILLFKDILNSIVLITQKNVTKKADLYYALQFLEKNNLNLAKTVILKD